MHIIQFSFNYLDLDANDQNETTLKQRAKKGTIVALNLVGILALDLLLLSLAMGSFFVFMSIYLAAPLFILMVVIFMSFYPEMKNAFLIAIFAGIPVSLMILVLSPTLY